MTPTQYKPERVYLIAKVTGLNPELVAEKYAKAKALFFGLGYEPVAPTDHCTPDTEWHEAMKICIPLLCSCDFYALLDDPSTTVGGMIENTIAGWVRIPQLVIEETKTHTKRQIRANAEV